MEVVRVMLLMRAMGSWRKRVKQLRGGSMQDVIFRNSERKR